MSDDYYHLAGYLKAGNTLEFLSFGPTQGRILQGILLYKFFQPAQISDFSIYRGVLLAGYILTGFMLFAVLRRHEPTVMSLLVSLCCLALLPFQAWLAWSMLLFVPYAALLGGLAGWISHIGICKPEIRVENRNLGGRCFYLLGRFEYLPASCNVLLGHFSIYLIVR